MKTQQWALLVALVMTSAVATNTYAVTVLGTGTGSLIGSDLTDIGDDGVEGSYTGLGNLAGFDAVFFADNEPNFSPPPNNEGSFNIFDNQVGSGQAKACCGSSPFPETIGADFSNTLPDGSFGIVLTSFTMTSGNDVPNRDPRVWRIEGSNDTTTGFDGTWTTIFSRTDGSSSDWTARQQVLQYSAGSDYALPEAYSAFRLVVDQTGETTGAFFQLNELELFGDIVPEPATAGMMLIAGGALALRRRRQAA